MTPNELSDQASIQCSNTLKERLRVALGESLNKLVYIGETERRNRVKSRSDVSDFMQWGIKEIPLDDFTFVVAADCRPGIRQLDVLLSTYDPRRRPVQAPTPKRRRDRSASQDGMVSLSVTVCVSV